MACYRCSMKTTWRRIATSPHSVLLELVAGGPRIIDAKVEKGLLGSAVVGNIVMHTERVEHKQRPSSSKGNSQREKLPPQATFTWNFDYFLKPNDDRAALGVAVERFKKETDGIADEAGSEDDAEEPEKGTTMRLGHFQVAGNDRNKLTTLNNALHAFLTAAEKVGVAVLKTEMETEPMKSRLDSADSPMTRPWSTMRWGCRSGSPRTTNYPQHSRTLHRLKFRLFHLRPCSSTLHSSPNESFHQ
jgi:hypothetical protein